MSQPLPSPPTRAYRLPTLRIVDLLTTQVQSVRIELVGNSTSQVTRLGTVLLYAPFVMIGYLLVLAALIKAVAVAWGWSLTCLLFGAAHMTIGLLGVKRGRGLGVFKKYDVVDPAIADGPQPATDSTGPSSARPVNSQVGPPRPPTAPLRAPARHPNATAETSTVPVVVPRPGSHHTPPPQIG